MVLRLLALVGCLLGVGVSAIPVQAHNVPRSQVELRTGNSGAEVTVTFSVIGFSLDYPAVQLGGEALEKAAGENRAVMAGAVAKRLVVLADGKAAVPAPLTPASSEFLPDRKVIRLHLRYEWSTPPKRLEVQAGRLFPVDPNHTVFVSIYDASTRELVREAVLGRVTPTLIYEVGTGQSTISVVRQFVREGIHHIFIGPDHILFIVGLLLMGGGLKRLLKIVTAFTVAHSITLVLATLNILDPSPRLIEPVIALSIVFVGVHSLIAQGNKEARDLRLVFAGVFGLIHGFGFASVLRELELPREALGWSLFSFNVGVEVGQACIVLAVAPLLALIARRSENAARRVVVIGSWCVVLAGAYWFGQRLAP
ncbi:MAG: HupE/UreJ family protein [Cytophagales bacterium]|nr:HupE/UreJ family protein [Armatimonadota bacterium]